MTGFYKVLSALAFFRTHYLRAALVFVAMLLATTTLHAQGGDKRQEMIPEQDDMQQAYQQVHADYMAAQQKLKQIQQDTLQAHPELRKQEQSFNDLLFEEMKSKGHKPKQDLAEIEKLQQELQNPEGSDNERQEMMAQYQAKMISFRKAQSEALQIEKVQQAQGDLMGAMFAAMKEQDPQTEQLMQQMTRKRQELEQMLEKASSQQQ